MSKARYTTALSIFAACIVSLTIIFTLYDEWWYGLIWGFLLGAIVAELIFWEESLAARLFIFFFDIAKTIFVFWLSFLLDGSVILFLIGLAIASPLIGAAGAVFSFGASLLSILAPFLFIYHVFALPSELD